MPAVSVRIDLEARRIDAGVRDLAGDPEKRAIGLSGTGLSRLWLGQELHRRVQNELLATEPGFRAEVPLGLELEIDGWTLALHGRADGVVFDGDTPVRVDEIKTLHFAVDLYHMFANEQIDRYRRQAAVYGLMLATPESAPTVRLILVDIATSEERDEEVSWNRDDVIAWLRQQVHRLVAVEQRRRERVAELQVIAERLPFPHPVARPAQEQISDAVASSLEQGRHLLVRAPTGSGKTAAVLHPALRTALSRGHRLVFLTAKTLQQRLVVDTAAAMQTDAPFRSLQLRAKAKMCVNREIICHEEFCPYAREYGLKLVRTGLLDNLLAESLHQDPDRLVDAGRQHEVCPFEVSLDLLRDVDLVVCDYNYVFDPGIGLGALLHGGALAESVLIIDEAHNLIDRSREYYSPALDSRLLDRADEYLCRRDTSVFRHLRALVAELADMVRGIVDEGLPDPREAGIGPAAVDRDRVADLRIAFDGAMLSYFMYKRENDLWLADDPAMDVFLALVRFHRVLSLGGDEFVHLAERLPDGGCTVKIFCRDASRFLGAILDECPGAVAMSATLNPFDFYRNLLGFDDHRTDELYVPSPFPPENRLVLSIPDVDTTYRNRTANYDPIASWIARLAPPERNALVLFPSYSFLSAVHDRLPPVGHELVVQRPGTSDLQQREVLTALGNGRAHMVLAVLGGIFAEGVDYPGEMLSQVIVVSPGLPQFNVERELLKRYYAELYGSGFGYAYLVPGLTRVVQAAGRLLRSDTDRGVIVLMCRRFQDARYARLLPEEWLDDGDPRALLYPDPVEAVREFFDSSSS